MSSKNLCVVAILDDIATEKIYELQRMVGRGDDLAAHITIANYNEIDANDLISYTQEFCSHFNSFCIDYIGIGVFYPPFIVAMPRLNRLLYDLYAKFHASYDDKCEHYTSINVGKWTPHTSLCSYSLDNIDLLIANFTEFTSNIIGLKIKDCNDNYKEIASFYFNNY